MRFFRGIRRRIRARDEDLRVEMEAHVQERIDDLVASGLSERDARFQAIREFGNVSLVVERSRDVWRWTAVDEFTQDIRYAWRTLRRSPGFSVIAVICLSLGIGATTTIFSLIYGVLLRPLPYRAPHELVAVWNSVTQDKGSKMFVPYSDLDNWREHARSFSDLAGVTWATNGRTMIRQGAAQKVLVIPATLRLFPLLGVPPALGRTFAEEDMSRGCTVVLAHRFWMSALGGQASILGRQLRFDDQSCTVVGVMPAGFALFPEPTEAWSLLTPASEIATKPDVSGVGVFARLKPGVSVSSAQAELKALATERNGGERYGVQMEPGVYPLQEEFTWLAGRNLRLSLMVLFGAVSAVLLIACVNIANLLVGRLFTRQREMALRAALGSGRGRLLRQLLTENLLLAVSSAIVGTALALAAVRYFNTLNPIELPAGSMIEVNLPVLAFTAGLAGLTTVLFGFVPVWKASGLALNEALKSGPQALPGSGKRRLTEILVAAEVTLSLALLVGAGLLIQSVTRFAIAPLGFDPQRLFRMPVSVLPQVKPEQRVAFYRQLLEDASVVAGLPGASLSTAVPVRGGRGSNILVVEGRPEPTPQTAVTEIAQQSISAQYFRSMGIPLLRGREFDDRDTSKAPPVAVVNDELARKYFPARDPVASRIRIVGESEWLTIVGVSADERRTTPYQEMGWVTPPLVYRPIEQRPSESANLLFRGAPVGQVEQKLRERNPDAFIGPPEPIERIVGEYLKYPRFRAVLAGVFSVLALVLTLAGLYGVLSQFVARRTREIGLRMALGAQRESVLSMIVKQGMALAGFGLTAGLLLTWWMTRFLKSLLYGVTPLDPTTLIVVSAILMMAALLAVYVPARRAASVDPMVALREE